jgi:hypothetical protein
VERQCSEPDLRSLGDIGAQVAGGQRTHRTPVDTDHRSVDTIHRSVDTIHR